MRAFWASLIVLLLLPQVALAQSPGLFDADGGKLTAVGWDGFRDTKFMIESIGALVLAIALGAAIGFHPTSRRTVDRLTEADMPKVYIMYAFIAAVIGVTVREFGMVIGVVVFGIGGLIRFRTDTGSTRDTGRLIAVTLTGLVAGLGLPHFAIITTAFAFILILFFDATPACRVKIDQLPSGRLHESADAYRAVLHAHRCKLIAEHKSSAKDRLEFVFRLHRSVTRDRLHLALNELPVELRGDIDWEIE
ncbi:MAG: hypothetical protein GC155_13200 [Alphaproteobacteria bacterium]|nr:hypothetical protein [Alphaproteobacteria bacterium]